MAWSRENAQLRSTWRPSVDVTLARGRQPARRDRLGLLIWATKGAGRARKRANGTPGEVRPNATLPADQSAAPAPRTAGPGRRGQDLAWVDIRS